MASETDRAMDGQWQTEFSPEFPSDPLTTDVPFNVVRNSIFT
jgi:hypothetical protein